MQHMRSSTQGRGYDLKPRKAAGPGALTSAQSKLAMGHLRVRFDPELGPMQWDADRRVGLVREVNVLLEAEGEQPVYTLEKLRCWISNTMYKQRKLGNKTAPSLLPTSQSPRSPDDALGEHDIDSPRSKSRPAKHSPRVSTRGKPRRAEDSPICVTRPAEESPRGRATTPLRRPEDDKADLRQHEYGDRGQVVLIRDEDGTSSFSPSTSGVLKSLSSRHGVSMPITVSAIRLDIIVSCRGQSTFIRAACWSPSAGGKRGLRRVQTTGRRPVGTAV